MSIRELTKVLAMRVYWTHTMLRHGRRFKILPMWMRSKMGTTIFVVGFRASSRHTVNLLLRIC